MKQHRVLGANPQQIQEIYEERVMSILRPKIVLNLACAKDKCCMLLADGIVYDFPKNSVPRQIDMPMRAMGQIEQLHAGETHFVAISKHLVWNVYTWGSTNSEGQLGRDIDSSVMDEDTQRKESVNYPGIVKDICARVVRVACGGDFTLCATTTGEVFGFGSSKDASFGQLIDKSVLSSTPPPMLNDHHTTRHSSSTAASGVRRTTNDEDESSYKKFPSISSTITTNHVVKIHWASDGDVEKSTKLSANGKFGLTWYDQPKPVFYHSQHEHMTLEEGQIDSSSTSSRQTTVKEEEYDDDKEVSSFSTMKVGDWFVPKDETEILINKHSKQAWRKCQQFAAIVQLNRQLERDVRTRLDELDVKIHEQELKCGQYSKTILQFDREGFRTIPNTRTLPHPSLEKTGTHHHHNDWKEVQLYLKRLNDSLDLLASLKQEQEQLKSKLFEFARKTRDSEICARDWRTRALLFERAILRVKREQRTRTSFRVNIGKSKVYPSPTWTRDLPKRVKVDRNEIWVLARLDPDWGLRLALNSIEFVLRSAPTYLSKGHSNRSSILAAIRNNEARLTHVFVAPNGYISKEERVKAKPNLVIPLRCSSFTDTTSRTLTFELQHHCTFQAKQIGEDTTFWVGFAFDCPWFSKFNKTDVDGNPVAFDILQHEELETPPGAMGDEDHDEQQEMINASLVEVHIEVHGDEHVSQRILDEVNEVGVFSKEQQDQWEQAQFELLLV
jgi:hypothetical protein